MKNLKQNEDTKVIDYNEALKVINEREEKINQEFQREINEIYKKYNKKLVINSQFGIAPL